MRFYIMIQSTLMKWMREYCRVSLSHGLLKLRLQPTLKNKLIFPYSLVLLSKQTTKYVSLEIDCFVPFTFLISDAK